MESDEREKYLRLPCCFVNAPHFSGSEAHKGRVGGGHPFQRPAERVPVPLDGIAIPQLTKPAWFERGSEAAGRFGITQLRLLRSKPSFCGELALFVRCIWAHAHLSPLATKHTMVRKIAGNRPAELLQRYKPLSETCRDCCSLIVPSRHFPHPVSAGEMLEKGRKVVKSSRFRNKKYFSRGLDYHKAVK